MVIWPSMTLLGQAESKLWTLIYASKSIPTSLILRQHPPKPYKLLQFFISFVTTVKFCYAPSIWKKMRWKSLCLLILKSITEIIKYVKSLYDFGGRCLKIKDVCTDFEPYFKVHNLVSVHPKSVILGQMTILNMVFHIVVSVYRLVKFFETRPSSLMNCGTANRPQVSVGYLTIRLHARVFYEQIVNEAQPSWLSLVENEGE